MSDSPVPPVLDHLVIAGPSLTALVDEVLTATGVEAQAGGRHPTGTANSLISLTVNGERRGHYLELIGPDPAGDTEAHKISTFGIASLDGPQLAAWAVHPADIEVASQAAADLGYSTGAIGDLSRARPDGTLLEWRLTRDGTGAPVIPFLIDWGTTAHPSVDTVPELELSVLEFRHPEPLWAESVLAALGVTDVTVTAGEPALRVELSGPGGSVRFG
ncbi:MAG: VOC family protein [Mycetocola sp.]